MYRLIYGKANQIVMSTLMTYLNIYIAKIL